MTTSQPPARPSTSSRRDAWAVLVAAMMGWMFDGLEMGLMPIVGRPALQDLLNVTNDRDVGRWLGVLTALFLVGAASGGWLFGWLGDRMGRVRSMALSILVYSVFTGLGYFAQQPWQLGALRFLAALGMGGEWSLGVALVVEHWPDRLRPLLAGVIGAAGNVGYLLIALVAMLFQVTAESWRWMMLAGMSPALLALLVLYFVPESVRWQRSVSGRAAQPLRELFTRKLIGPTILGTLLAAIPLIGTWGAVSAFLPAWVDQLVGQSNPYAKGSVQFVVSIGAILGCLAGPLLGGLSGRRPAYFLLCTLSLAVTAVLYRGLTQFDALFLAMSLLAGFATASFYGWLPLYLPELFPTRVRAMGQGVSFNTGRLFAAVGTLGTGQLLVLLDGSYARACASITLIYALGMVIIWFAPETKGKPLPE